jgi:hypothetical protein
MSATDATSRRDAVWVALLVVAFAAFGTLFALYLAFSDGEWSFLVYGRMLLRGELAPFQDEMTGRRLPVPAYVIGLSQVLWGPSPLLGRLWSLVFGGTAVWLTFLLGRRLGGRTGGFLAVLLVVTHPVVVGFYASASYYAMSAVLILAAVLAIVAWPTRAGRLAAMACVAVLWLTRVHLLPMIPFVFLYLLSRAEDRRERAALVLITALPPAVFLLWRVEHLKVLAYVPLLSRLVEPLGYRSLLEMGAAEMLPDADWLGGAVWFAKRHAFWLLATLVLAVATLVVRWRGDAAARRLPPAGVVFTGVLAIYMFLSQIAMIYVYPKVVAAWAVTFAPLWAVVLGWATAALLERGRAPAPLRAAVGAVLVAGFALSPSVVKHAAMPHPLPPRTTLALIDEDAATIRSVAPKGARVFLVGSPIPAYVAEVRPYVQQIFAVWTLVPSRDAFAVRRSGVWGPNEIDEWLGHDAPFALIEPGRLDALEQLAAYRPVIGRIRALLEGNFARVARGGHGGGTPAFDVYARRSRATAALAR